MRSRTGRLAIAAALLVALAGVAYCWLLTWNLADGLHQIAVLGSDLDPHTVRGWALPVGVAVGALLVAGIDVSLRAARSPVAPPPAALARAWQRARAGDAAGAVPGNS